MRNQRCSHCNHVDQEALMIEREEDGLWIFFCNIFCRVKWLKAHGY